MWECKFRSYNFSSVYFFKRYWFFGATSHLNEIQKMYAFLNSVHILLNSWHFRRILLSSLEIPLTSLNYLEHFWIHLIIWNFKVFECCKFLRIANSLASLSAPRARDSIVALRAPFFLDLAFRARSCALRIHLSLFLII